MDGRYKISIRDVIIRDQPYAFLRFIKATVSEALQLLSGLLLLETQLRTKVL